MAVGVDAVTRAVARRHGENPDCAFGMVGGNAVLLMAVLVVRRARQGFASPMAVVAGVNFQEDAARVHRGAPCIARPTEAAGGACSKAATKVLREAHPYVRVTVAAGDACMKEAGFAQRACTVAPTIVWRMAVAKDARWLGAPEAQEAALTAVSGTAGVNGANTRGAGKAPREAQTTARRTAAASAALGTEDARSLLAEEAGCVPHTGMLQQLRRLRVLEE